jgi:signal transduction histidine kinase/CheY-like chemotaxis protein
MPAVPRPNPVVPSRAIRAWFFTIVLGLVAIPASAQEPSHWRFYSSLDGFPESWVADVTAGPSGRVFITHGDVATMSVYDGYRVSLLPSPGPNLTVREGPDGRLWALWPLTPEPQSYRGLQSFDGTRWTQHPVSIDGPFAQSRRDFLPWERGRVLVVTPDRVIEFDEASGNVRELLRADKAGLGAFLGCEAALKGGAWVAAARGLLHLGTTGHVEQSWTYPPGADGELRANIAEGVDGRVIVTMGRLQPATSAQRVVLVHGSAVRVLAERTESDHVTLAAWPGIDGSWWLASILRTSFELEEHREDQVQVVPRRGMLSAQWLNVAPDGVGGMWIATALGLVRHSPAPFRPPPSVPDPGSAAGAILETRRGELIVARDRHLLSSLDGIHWQTRPYLPDMNMRLYQPTGLAELPDGRIAVGTAPGLRFYNPATGGFETAPAPEGAVSAVIVGSTKAGGAWVLANPGSDGSWLETYGSPSAPVRIGGRPDWKTSWPRTVIEAASGEIYLVPDGRGIGRLRDGTLELLDAARGYPGRGAFAGAEVAPGRFWFGDRDSVLEFDGARWREIRRGLKSVRAILVARDGAIWVTSGSGLHRYRDGSWITFTAEDGLPDGGVNSMLEDRSGRLWVTTTGGLSLFHPDVDSDPPDTVIDRAANPREVPPGGEAHLSFSGSDRWEFTTTDRLLYSWRVDGGGWTPLQTETSATVLGLAAGRHIFEVRAVDRAGNVDPSPAALEFVVLRPWFLATGFLLGGLPVLLLLGGGIGLFVTRYLRLERLVDERTRELQEANVQVRREAEERRAAESRFHNAQKLEAVGRLAGGVAHDFNNLLTVITGCAELLGDDLPPEAPERSLVDEIGRAAGRATAMTRQLLAFGRHQVMRPETLDLNSVVQEISRMLRRLIGEDVSLEFTPVPDLWPVVADRGQIEQVLVNLAVNARDAMPGGGRLAIGLQNVIVDEERCRQHADARPGPCVRLSVSDTGMGMDPQIASRIFEPFFTTKDPGAGTGLGLSVVYGVVHGAGGWIAVDSAAGRGTTFDIYLPRGEEVRTAVAAEAPKSAAQRGAETVLVAEDEHAVRTVAATGLRRFGYTVIEATSAEDAEEQLAALGGRVHLLLTDIVMTGRSGLALAERVRRRWPAIRVLFMSGYANRASTGGDVFDGHAAFIQKPFTVESLVLKVRETLDR